MLHAIATTIRQHWRRARYVAYLRSDAWHAFRRRVLARDGYRCRDCGDTQSLEVHHCTYERFGHEQLADCIALCYSCHQKRHGRRGRGRR
jgi:5-methylcytosine-specific restriction endonuclease McrA